MAPPFIAYFGALQDDAGGLALLQVAYDQIRLYRDALFDANVSLWRHIALGSLQDSGHWATGTPQSLPHKKKKKKTGKERGGGALTLFDVGNGWAAAGIMRVLVTILRSNFASQMESQQSDLTNWVDEILTGVWKYQVRGERSPFVGGFG